MVSLRIAILRVLVRRQIQCPTAPRQLLLRGPHVVIVQVGLDVGTTTAPVLEATEEGDDSDSSNLQKKIKIKNSLPFFHSLPSPFDFVELKSTYFLDKK